MRLCLDASAIIYALEGNPSIRAAVVAWVEKAEGRIITSRLSMLECLVKPTRNGDKGLTETYTQFFANRAVTIAEIDAFVIAEATTLRARLALRTPDAIHLATAVTVGASHFLTGDRDFATCRDFAFTVVMV
jgi:predicted nucleic acid-binding protein